MATWASRRKVKYAFSLVISLLILIGVPIFLFLYEKPTCFDGKQNGGEFGVDCGGSCSRLCQSAFLSPKIEWGGAKWENVGPSVYNVAAYITNPNVNGGALGVPYKFTVFDASGSIIGEREGRVDLYPHRNSLVFQGQVRVQNSVPAKVTFEFLEAPAWFKSEDVLGDISIISKNYEEGENGSSMQVTLENRGLQAYNNLMVGVVLYDGSGNVTGFSQTKIDYIAPKNGRSVAPYTWPIVRNGKVVTEEVILSARPVQDSK